MKKKLILFLSSLTLIGCKKDFFDYRTKYIGDYIFTNHRIDKWYSGVITLDTTYTYNGKIEYGTEKNSIMIYFEPNEKAEVFIYEDGTLDAPSGYYTQNGYIRGEFESMTSIRFTRTSSAGGGYSTNNITGEKK